jgi:hypothetical protein
MTHSVYSSVGDVETQQSTQSWTIGSGISHQQVGNAWLETSNPDAGIVSLSASGDINILDKRMGDKVAKVIHVRLSLIDSIQKKRSKMIIIRSYVGSPEGRNGGNDFFIIWPLLRNIHRRLS